MDRTRTKADGARAVSRRGRAWNPLVAALVVQNLLVASCLLLSLYVYWCLQWDAKPNNVHIQFLSKSGGSHNQTVVFPEVSSQYKMSVPEPTRDRIRVDCTGPYLVHMHVCHRSMEKSASRGTLALQPADGGAAPLASFSMNASFALTCSLLHDIVYLREKEQVSLNMYLLDDFKMVNLTVGLSLLVPGESCL